ncbi:16S rRNA (adenine(1518)-N(6)/adenine(1519)-N(6))-dimethyltransferase RsmA [Clostridium tyrobutyricum]|jgi:16S rRNA (adenine1518-N6/adenine1519-N6)-dimethyltransferase|uniref:Ribosomal RNA small subunit methyltransferase A n=1 Tax=Clostridium tyrobutyricum DIVETGP TaxID=1408889 RepID=W6NE39_CLOTY|nr:16S rRNA (adenine(1518)-N(6)/adenine(1519)-N(6))-dimethyltransferase RsmA [Clostridium tyrobutyricum]AND83353.1 ribosomal RNA small subunit methyltransferase A [Clostridium tyrobutyricum]ANP68157.1 16S rRNA (adenine(1518)-N(6)/adenine(1519)-N(6))-dimethyltransferase [Clostridium tyrobutyricum]MBR9648922.1 16S rRNA (adenine(1518)-N(6)/adenine(1519)-N(6))-dimethyltransferase RsmA [Clostridium tyrobutyricum]MBV4416336.1 16S rRNA (adenine(1518)-N(6)/adenine(1519)-N(6))-dimethyltransferase RsmA [
MEKFSTKDIVYKYKFKFSKNLGQNFLIDDSVLEDIICAADISNGDLVIEIGPGVGTLTRELLNRANKVCAIELDSGLIPILQEELKDFPNFELIHGDALKTDFNKLIGDYSEVKFVANLPYYVTTPIISKILTEDYKFKSLTIMIQKEVGERIAAKPDCKQYGALSILVQYYCDVSVIRKVTPDAFIPSPKVDSIVIKLDRLSEPKIVLKDKKLFFKIVRLAFNMRRKTLWNALKPLKISKVDMELAFERSSIDPRRRGETLSIKEFGKLSDSIHELL